MQHVSQALNLSHTSTVFCQKKSLGLEGGDRNRNVRAGMNLTGHLTQTSNFVDMETKPSEVTTLTNIT